MGGGIALLATMPGGPLHKVVKGVILLSPMCKIADDMMMPTWVVRLWTHCREGIQQSRV